MAITYANTEYGVIAGGPGSKWAYTEMTLDSSYTSGGEIVTATDFGMTSIRAIFPAYTVGGYIVEFSKTTDAAWKVKAYMHINITTSASVLAPEVNVARSLSTVVIPVLIRGT